jgi:molybdopterin-guanine dinucleotide biosynthesis protein A
MVAPGPYLNAAGFAVAGGRSSRMGRDKAALAWGAGDLLDHALARLSTLTGDVRILCGPEARYADRGRAVLPDVAHDIGPLAALLTAVRALPPDGTAVLLAVDLPLVTPDFLRALLDLAAADGGVDAVVPVSPLGAEPFCAVYRASCREAVEGAVAAGRLKMTAFWTDARVREVAGAELQALGDSARLFRNVNTPADYEDARRMAGA